MRHVVGTLHDVQSLTPMTENEQTHSQLLREAARQFLGPLGLRQKGRSRTWLDDNRWWLCIVEFQPSGWSRGSHLNVGCMWLWQETNNLRFDEGYRVENFVAFKNSDQFESVAEKLAKRAAIEVERYRSSFATVSDVADYYMKKIPAPTPKEFWSNFHAAVACGAVGRASVSRQFFEQVLRDREDLDWIKAAQTEAAALISVLDDTDRFRHIVREKVIRTRELLKLPKQETASLTKLASQSIPSRDV